MSYDEAAKLVAYAVAALPQYQERDLKPTIALWHDLLSDLGFDGAFAALRLVLCRQPYWPTVAEIRQAYADLTEQPSLTFDEAWAQVKVALARHGTWDERAALAMLDPDVAEVAANLGWRDICMSEEPDVVRGQFRMAWEAHERRRRDLARLPISLQARMDGRRRLSLPERAGFVPLAELAREE